ncbi:hypothetical protein B7P43_G05569 [Cryptotermes secundus]|uniref:Dynein regulatory complex protein 1 C-terminal domain-containing protein n=3 Tax=Cryptotermes secundus TaxID=105785 RepID=A0A2J7PDE2_9NEOP|nr:hypothetical protein B7P43_G05569 [Cryptotermes secundus]
MQVVADVSPKKDAHDTESGTRPFGFPMTKEVETVHAEDVSVWKILKLVADNSDFLAEKQLKDLLEPYTDKEKMLVKIDSVFTILGVNTEAEILMLKKCFLPYAKCSVCSTQQEERATTIFKGSHSSLGSTSTPGNTDTAMAGLVPDTNNKFGVESAEEDEQLHDMDITATEVTSTPPTSIADITDKLHFIHSKPDCPDTHSLVIDPVFVLKVLRDFVTKFSAEEYRHLTNLTSSFSAKHSTLCRLISTQDVANFWTKFREIFSPEREKLWDGLLIGLQRYHCILEDRHKLNVKTEKLRQQNADLRRLLHFYIQNPENESMFLSSWERLKPISRNGLQRKSKIKFARATTSIGRKST